MRLFEIDNSELSKEHLYQLIKERAQEYISDNPEWLTKPLCRGINEHTRPYHVKHTPENRQPKDSSIVFQDFMKEIYEKLDIRARRDNSIFCSFNKTVAANYGTIKVIIPLDSYHCSQMTNVVDLYDDTGSLFKHGLVDIKNPDTDNVWSLRYLYYFGDDRNAIRTELENKYDLGGLNRVSFNKLIKIAVEMFGTTPTKAKEKIFSNIHDSDMWQEIIIECGIKDTGLSQYIRDRVPTDFSNMNSKSEILLGDSEYIEIDYSFWDMVFLPYVEDQQ